MSAPLAGLLVLDLTRLLLDRLLSRLLGRRLLLRGPRCALLIGAINLVLLVRQRRQALLGLSLRIHVALFTSLADNLLERHDLRLNAALGLRQTLLVALEILLLKLLCTRLHLLGILQGRLLTALRLAQARGQLVDTLLDVIAVLIELFLRGSRLGFNRLWRFFNDLRLACLSHFHGGRNFVLANVKF